LALNVIFMPFFNYIGAILLYSLKDSPKLELFVIMIIAPVICTFLQLWWTDTFLQRQSRSSEDLELSYTPDRAAEQVCLVMPLDNKQEPLLRNS
jgi:hypothetical protein